MKYLFYTTSQSAWDGLYQAMQRAKKTIYVEMYIFIDDTEKTNDFITLLSEKAKKGVAVRMVLDGFGSFGLSNKAQKILREAGVELLFFNKLFRRLHRKIAVVDETVGFFGGVNIHELAREWNDLLVRVEGPIVGSLVRSFRRTYKACGGKDPYILSYKEKAIFGRTRIWLMEHIPYIRKPRLRDAYTESMHKAKHRITLVTPYFTPSKWLIRLLIAMVRKKIEVEVIIPRTPDVALFARANLRYMTMLAPYGVTFYRTTAMTHAKLLLIDESLALVGSQNIDALSFAFNAEIGVFFTDARMLADLMRIVNAWKKDSEIFVPQKKVSIFDRMLSFFVRLLQPLL